MDLELLLRFIDKRLELEKREGNDVYILSTVHDEIKRHANRLMTERLELKKVSTKTVD